MFPAAPLPLIVALTDCSTSSSWYLPLALELLVVLPLASAPE
jgi:hypothetical protein